MTPSLQGPRREDPDVAEGRDEDWFQKHAFDGWQTSRTGNDGCNCHDNLKRPTYMWKSGSSLYERRAGKLCRSTSFCSTSTAKTSKDASCWWVVVVVVVLLLQAICLCVSMQLFECKRGLQMRNSLSQAVIRSMRGFDVRKVRGQRCMMTTWALYTEARVGRIKYWELDAEIRLAYLLVMKYSWLLWPGLLRQIWCKNWYRND